MLILHTKLQGLTSSYIFNIPVLRFFKHALKFLSHIYWTKNIHINVLQNRQTFIQYIVVTIGQSIKLTKCDYFTLLFLNLASKVGRGSLAPDSNNQIYLQQLLPNQTNWLCNNVHRGTFSMYLMQPSKWCGNWQHFSCKLYYLNN